jgi:hypothetical protein
VKAKSIEQTADSREQGAKNRDRETETRQQRAESSKQRAKSKEQRAETADLCPMQQEKAIYYTDTIQHFSGTTITQYGHYTGSTNLNCYLCPV